MVSQRTRPGDGAALVLLHFQRCITEPGVCFDYSPEDVARITSALGAASQMLASARETNTMVVHVAYSREHERPFSHQTKLSRLLQTVGAFEADTVGFEFADELTPANGETVVQSGAISGFVNTGLHRRLERAGVGRLVLSGITTSWAVESTARHASDLGYQLTIAADACVDESDAAHQSALQRLEMIATIDDGWSPENTERA